MSATTTRATVLVLGRPDGVVSELFWFWAGPSSRPNESNIMERSLSRTTSTLSQSQPAEGARAARCPALGTGLGGVHAVRLLLMIPYIFALLFSGVLRDVRLDRSFFSSPVPFLSSDVGACTHRLVRVLGVVATMLSHVLEAYRRRKLTLPGAPARPP